VAAILSKLRDDELLDLGSCATGSSASRPRLPLEDAVDRAGVSVAVHGLSNSGAGLATVESGLEDLASACLDATATVLGAQAKFTPRSNDTVNRALESVAGTGVCKSAARLAAMLGSSGNGPRAGLRADGATSLCACGPLSPFGEDAVDGASLGVAVFIPGESWARLASVSGVDGNFSAADLSATTTGEAALAAGVEARDNAVNRASESVALGGLPGGAARDTTMGRCSGDAACSELSTRGASCSASRPGGEFG
jgi:hypothetical protein